MKYRSQFFATNAFVDLNAAELSFSGSISASETQWFTIPTSLFTDATVGVFVRFEFLQSNTGDELDLFVDVSTEAELPLSNGAARCIITVFKRDNYGMPATKKS